MTPPTSTTVSGNPQIDQFAAPAKAIVTQPSPFTMTLTSLTLPLYTSIPQDVNSKHPQQALIDKYQNLQYFQRSQTLQLHHCCTYLLQFLSHLQPQIHIQHLQLLIRCSACLYIKMDNPQYKPKLLNNRLHPQLLLDRLKHMDRLAQTGAALDAGSHAPKGGLQMTPLVGAIHHLPHGSSYFLGPQLVYPGHLSL